MAAAHPYMGYVYEIWNANGIQSVESEVDSLKYEVSRMKEERNLMNKKIN